MSLIFDSCSTLISIPDISKWNISNVQGSLSNLFEGYEDEIDDFEEDFEEEIMNNIL